MAMLNDLTGQIFGQLTVLSYSGRNADKKSLWNCRCACGNLCVKRAVILLKGKELYCGKEHPNKVCTSCGIDKPKSEFHKANISQNKLNPRCKECIGKWYEDNKVRLQEEYKKQWSDPERKKRKVEANRKSRIKNREQQRRQKREYGKRPEVMERKKKEHHARKVSDPAYVIKRRLRGRIRDLVRHNIAATKAVKYKSSLVLLGCDVEFFKAYLESKFYDGMSWENISEWHIDHIKPCSKFDLTKLKDQAICFHYTNLQPLWWRDNLIKSYLYEDSTPINNPSPPHSLQKAV